MAISGKIVNVVGICSDLVEVMASAMSNFVYQDEDRIRIPLGFMLSIGRSVL